MSTPKVTVLMPVYNGERYLKDAINSILNQTFSDFEFLIINDGSTDNTVSIVTSFKDKRIRLIENEKNIGIVETLNKAIGLAKGEYIARMDSDDISLLTRLEKEVEVLDRDKNIALVAAHFILIDEAGNDLGFWPQGVRIKSNEQIRKALPKENCIAHPSVMIRTNVLKEYMYRKAQHGAEDWDLWLRMASDGKAFFKINEVLLQYRLHAASVTTARNRNGAYLNNGKIFTRYSLFKLGKLRFNMFDLKVLLSGLFNYFNHFLSLISPDFPAFLSGLFSKNIFKVFRQLFYLRSIPSDTNISMFVFIPYCGTKERYYTYFRFLEQFDGKRTMVFFTAENDSKKSDINGINISAITEYPLIHKLVKRMIAKRIKKAVKPIVIGFDSMFFYSFLLYIKGTECADVIEKNMNLDEPNYKLVYDYGKWAMPLKDRLTQRIVVGKGEYEEIAKLYGAQNNGLELLKNVKCADSIMDTAKMIEHG